MQTLGTMAVKGRGTMLYLFRTTACCADSGDNGSEGTRYYAVSLKGLLKVFRTIAYCADSGGNDSKGTRGTMHAVSLKGLIKVFRTIACCADSGGNNSEGTWGTMVYLWRDYSLLCRLWAIWGQWQWRDQKYYAVSLKGLITVFRTIACCADLGAMTVKGPEVLCCISEGTNNSI